MTIISSAPLAACNGRPAEGGDCPAAARAHTVSGFCVPRYVSLKRGEVYGRRGPGKDYPALWIYRARGLPVQVVAETSEWRRVCDPQGGAVWINRSMVDGRRTVMAVGVAPVGLAKTAAPGAPAAGLLAPHALANLDRCQGGWCRVSVAGVSGWVPAARLWGVAPAAQCR
jgi:SH3-like domain-containing protein